MSVRGRRLQCRPRGICSWDYLLEGNGFRGWTRLHLMSEQGDLIVNGVAHEVVKHGFASGRWTLHRGGRRIASAEKISVFWRAFEITADAEHLTLQALSVFRRAFALDRDRRRIATFEPHHAFTRRATIATAGEPVDDVLLCFSFWLTVVLWRRAAQSN